MPTPPPPSAPGSDEDRGSSSETSATLLDQIRNGPPVLYRQELPSSELEQLRRIETWVGEVMAWDEDLRISATRARCWLDALNAWHRRHHQAMAPVSKAELLNALADLADLLQTKVPGEGGIDLYLEAMDSFPQRMLRPTQVMIARDHKFTRLPLPADWRRTAEEQLDSALAFAANLARLTVRVAAAHKHLATKEQPHA